MSYKIRIREFLLTQKNSSEGVISEVEIDEEIVASGAYGYLYKCTAINGKLPSTPQLIKIFKEGERNSDCKGYQVIIQLQSRLTDYFRQGKINNYTSLDEVPALKAIPIFSFEGSINGKIVKGFSAINLLEIGFVSFDDVLTSQHSKWEIYRGLPFKTRYKYCFHLVKGFQILTEINYVHADINPANIFINLFSGELSIIDFDGGNIVESFDDETLTYGKLDEGYWMAPEIYEQRELNQGIHPNLNSDRWSVGIGLHYLIFMYDPFFFIKEHSKKCKELYLRDNKFYPINLDDENISEDAIYSIEAYEYVIKKELPELIHNELIKNYEEGFFYPGKRTDYSVWSELFRQTQDQPVIEYFNSDKNFIFKDTLVKLEWEVRDFFQLSIDNQIGDVTWKKEIEIKPEENSIYHLTARGHFGTAFRKVELNIIPFPLLEYLKIPTPQFSTSVNFDTTQIMVPDIDLSVVFEGNKLCGVPTEFVSLLDDTESVKAFFKKKPTFWNIRHVFNTITEKVFSTYNV